MKKDKVPHWSKIKKVWVVNGHPWEVEFTRNPLEGGAYGECDFLDEKIRVHVTHKGHRTNSHIIETLIHELLHVIEHEHEITLGHKVINKLEKPLRDLIFNNL